MAKPPVKRKSEGALLNGKAKHRKTTKSRDELSESERDTQSSQELFVSDEPSVVKHVKRSNVKSGRSELALPVVKPKKRKTVVQFEETPVSQEVETQEVDSQATDAQSGQDDIVVEQPVTTKRVKNISVKSRQSGPAKSNRIDEYDEDPGREESLQFLSMLEQFEGKKKKAAVKEITDYKDKLTQDVDRDQTELKKMVDRLSDVSAKKDAEFLSNFRRAFKAAAPFQPKSKSSAERTGFATMYDRSNLIKDNAFGLITKFEEVNQYISKLDTTELMDNEWGGEDEKMANLLLIGRDLGISRYRKVLMISHEDTLSAEELAEGEGFYTGEQDSLWGKVARKEEKAVKKLIKATALEG